MARVLVAFSYQRQLSARAKEAVQEALVLWEERERRRLQVLAMVDEAEASIASHEGPAFDLIEAWLYVNTIGAKSAHAKLKAHTSRLTAQS